MTRVWDDLVARAREVAHYPPAATGTLSSLGSNLAVAIIAKPKESQRVFCSLAGTIDRAAAYEAESCVADGRPAMVSLINLGNALDCVGCPVSATTRALFLEWLTKSTASREDTYLYDYWTTGFAALALGSPAVYRPIAGRAGIPVLAFTPGQTLGFNLQGLLEHLAAAVENGAPLVDVLPAWEELLGNYDTLSESRSLDEATLLWIARVVHHRIGGAPLGEVSQRLHDDCWRIAGLA